MAKIKAYEGNGVTIHFNARRCIHAAECVHGLPSVFDADRRPWIQAEAGSVEEIADVVHRCPSGALSYERSDGGPPEPVDSVAHKIVPVKNGPLYVQGTVEVMDHEGRVLDVGPRVALCRCGASKNKPFCDNSHIEAEFRDDA